MRKTGLAARMSGLDDEELLPPRSLKEDTVTTTVRMGVSLLQKVDEIAGAEGFSRAQLINSFVQACVRSYEKRKKHRPTK